MSRSKTVITTEDLRRLKVLLASEFAQAIGRKEYLTRLEQKLCDAKVVCSTEVLPNVVTMNSTFRLRELRTDDVHTYTLVYPEEACIAEGKLSVLTPLGSEILGHCSDEEIVCRVLDREDRRRIEAVSFQPERMGAMNM
ncbi:Regulator of nucleoside diphosphate kinase [Novipirellula aureliae]|uniref:Regulator of nucleoside diphosphate kinase n=1 Tax=Novipirellula aureliae TaxID=2527966 RepID=A0A5C6E8Y9_9BACT|nr:GreA/GreB family elongation factor [Novipirellula aureliae]TWU45015.1 Regulator of nucleoside diphosphate kinase [Novipirellula aureliae]